MAGSPVAELVVVVAGQHGGRGPGPDAVAQHRACTRERAAHRVVGRAAPSSSTVTIRRQGAQLRNAATVGADVDRR
jgi:hypothetical protein